MGHTRRVRLFMVIVTAVAAVAARPSPVTGTMRTERYEIQARFETRQAFHHDAFGSFDWVRERNEFRYDMRYRLTPRGSDFGPIDEAFFNIVYRARYDGIYDIREVYRRRGYDRDDFRFPEGKTPRELFLDFDFLGPLSPLSVRIGKFQTVWGEADLFRSLDIVNPLRLDQVELIGEDFDDYREPLWTTRFFWSLGQLGPVADTGLEVFYSPNSRPLTHRVLIGEGYRIKLDPDCRYERPVDCRRPSKVPFNQVRAPAEVTRVGTTYGDAPDSGDAGALGKGDFIYLVDDQWPTSEISFDRASMAGFRALGLAYNVYFSLNYLYKRSEVPGFAANFTGLFDPNIAQDGSVNARTELLARAAAAEATPDANGNGVPDGREQLIEECLDQNQPRFILTSLRGYPDRPFSGCLGVEPEYPWTHILGLTATYNDYDYTGMILRLEQSYSTKEHRGNGIPPLGPPNRQGNFPTERDFATRNLRETDVWRSMVGFDLLRSFSGYMPRAFMRYKYLRTWFLDQWLLSGQFLNEYYATADNQVGLLVSLTDRVHHHNPLISYLMTGFFLNSKFRPLIAFGYDVNDQFPLWWLQAEFTPGRSWTIRVGDIIWAGSKHKESFFFLHRYADRDQLYLQVTYYII